MDFKEQAEFERAKAVLDGLDVHLIYSCLAGSKAYGRSSTNSDTDIRGIFLPAAADVLLQKEIGTIRLKDGDVEFHPIAKFFKLAANGNPNVLEWLFVREDHIFMMDCYGQKIRENRSLFLSQKLFSSFFGYAKGSWKTLSKLLETPMKPGSDAWNKARKHAMHIERLLTQLVQILETGSFCAWNPDYTEPFVTLQNSEIQKLILNPDYLCSLHSLQKRIEQAKASTILPEQPDYKALDRFRLEVMQDLVRAALNRDSRN